MTYDQSMEWLYSRLRFGMKLGLENMQHLCRGLGNVEKELTFIHVAGTNGKGSVCAMIESILRAAGRRTGLFTSPHLIDFRERVRVDGALPPKEPIAEALTRIREYSEGANRSPTYFEVSTALAFLLFKRANCEIVILETGMGGRLDSTNVVTPAVSVITPIGMDHAEHLGDTISKIAREKAGIIKPGKPVVSAPQEPDAATVLRVTARRLNSELIEVRHPLMDLPLRLPAAVQRMNAAVAVAAVQAAPQPPPQAAIETGLATVQWPARFQRLRDNLVIDGAHNPPGARVLVATWREEFGEQRPTILFSGVVQKDHAGILRELKLLSDDFVFVPMRVEKAESIDRLVAAARSLAIEPLVCTSVEAGLAATGNRLTLAAGSLFLAGEILELLPDGGNLFPHLGSLED